MKSGMARLVMVVFCIAVIMGVTTCVADEVTTPIPGDPTIYPPGCKTLQPAPATLGDIGVMLATGALLILF